MSVSTSMPIVDSSGSFTLGEISIAETTLLVGEDGVTLKKALSEDKRSLFCATLDCRLCFRTCAWGYKRCSCKASLGVIRISINDKKSIFISKSCLKGSQFAKKPEEYKRVFVKVVTSFDYGFSS